MMGGTEDLHKDDDAESMAGKNPASALRCLSLSSARLTSCVRNDRCHVKPSGVMCFCTTRYGKFCSSKENSFKVHIEVRLIAVNLLVLLNGVTK
jgi:hypothetical protein